MPTPTWTLTAANVVDETHTLRVPGPDAGGTCVVGARGDLNGTHQADADAAAADAAAINDPDEAQ